MNILLSLRSEILKTKRTAAFYFALIGAAIVPCIFLLNILTDGLEATRKDPLNAIFKLSAEMNALAFFPLFVVLVCTLLPQIEYRNNTWKQVLTSPKTKAAVFLAKYLTVHLLVILFLVAAHLFMFIAIAAAHFIDPSLQLLDQPLNRYRVLANAVNLYLTLLAVCTLQFWIGLRFRNFIVPTAVGLALWLTGTLLVFQFNSDLANYFPYSFHVFNVSTGLTSGINQVAWTSFGYAVLFLLLGYLDFRRRRMGA
jgi:lantibiotic transport system permease protein